MYHDGVAHTDPPKVVLSVKERLNDQFIQKWRAELSSSSKENLLIIQVGSAFRELSDTPSTSALNTG